MKAKSYLLIFSLTLILTFILGVRYGQKVEQTNKVINYLLSITPTTPPPTPTPFKYATSESKIWKVKFIYPSFLKIKEDPTRGAVIFEP
ncbi:MAG: hypothetical protein ACK4FL_02290 [Microgenomates group bacterium]